MEDCLPDPLRFLRMISMLKGLLNAPAAFQQFMNNIFADMIDVIVSYIWMTFLSILTNISEHKAHVKEVLRRLRTNGLFARADKCEFHVTSCEYLRYMLSPEGLTMALTSPNYPRLAGTWKVQRHPSFLGFTNFYVVSFSDTLKITVPLMCLTCRVPLALHRWVLFSLWST